MRPGILARPLSAARKRLLVVALPALVYVLLSPPIGWPLYSAILFRPIRQQAPAKDSAVIAERYHAKLTELVFPAKDGALIHGRFFELPGSKRVFLASEGCGGNMYRRINHAQFLLQCGGSVMQYDYEGYGASQGKPTLDGVCDDALAAYDYLISHQGKSPCEIVLYGESFGSGVTGQLAAKRKVAGVILHSGFSSLLSAARDIFPWLRLYPDNLFPHQMMDNIQVFGGPHPPLLIMHGDKDDRVFVHNARDLYAAASEPKTLLIVPNGGHSAFGYHGQNAVADFLKKNSI